MYYYDTTTKNIVSKVNPNRNSLRGLLWEALVLGCLKCDVGGDAAAAEFWAPLLLVLDAAAQLYSTR